MALRLTALLVALFTGAQGVVPSLDGVRCLVTGQRMAASCCPREAEPDGGARLARRCCERLAAPALEARATASSDAHRLSAPPALAFALPSPPTGGEAIRLLFAATRSRGRPPAISSTC